MSSVPKRASLFETRQLSALEFLLLISFLGVGVTLVLLGAAQAVKYHEVSKALALCSAGVLAFLSACFLQFQTKLKASRTLPGIALTAVAALWLVWIAVIAYTHRIQGWDECAYMLGGMALRGYSVPYAPHRAPVTELLCAVFYGFDRFLNPVLLCGVLALVFMWLRRLLGPVYATLGIFILFCQSLFLESTADIMSELPAALLVIGGFFLLAKQKTDWSALCFALVIFSRWNLAPVWMVVLAAVFLRSGIRAALKFVGIALATFAVWYALTLMMGTPDPLMTVYRGNFLPGLAWTADPKHKPDFLLRLDFYAQNFFFLTPAVLIGLLASPIQNFRKKLSTERWVILMVIPVSFLAYLFTMLNMGGLFPRFVTPLIPAAIVFLLYWLFEFSDNASLSARSRRELVAAAAFVTCAVGLWPLFAIVEARVNLNTQSVFSPQLRKELRNVDRKAVFYSLSRQPLSTFNGQRAMFEAGHKILFPSAQRDFNGELIEETDSADGVRTLEKAAPSGSLLLIQKKYADRFPANALLFSDSDWALLHRPD